MMVWVLFACWRFCGFVSRLILYLCVFCLCLCTDHMYTGSSRTGVSDGCELPYGCRELNSVPLQEYGGLLTSERPSNSPLPLILAFLLAYEGHFSPCHPSECKSIRLMVELSHLSGQLWILNLNSKQEGSHRAQP